MAKKSTFNVENFTFDIKSGVFAMMKCSFSNCNVFNDIKSTEMSIDNVTFGLRGHPFSMYARGGGEGVTKMRMFAYKGGGGNQD